MSVVRILILALLFLTRVSLANDVVNQDEVVDLLIRTQKDQPIYSEILKQRQTLPAGTLIALSLAKKDLAPLFHQVQLHVRSLLPILTANQNAPYLHSVDILDCKNRSLENSEVLLNLVSMIQNNSVQLEGYEYDGSDPQVEVLSLISSESSGIFADCPQCEFSQASQPNSPLDQTPMGVLALQTKGYGVSNVIQQLIGFAKRNISFLTKKGVWVMSRNPKNKCVRYVKQALKKSLFFLDAKGQPMYPASRNSIQLAKDLKDHGFINLLETSYKSQIKSPYDSPVGAVLIYVGGAGHAEIRTKDGFISDYFSERARTGNPEKGFRGNSRELKGVYINLRALSMS